eukprot:gnl/Dysnectes_brevis/461_a513_3144.p1 GENE.gnl/Dysnectes_brevis/461_a513_3144~~gnl/Dysnectes_brevis/461_a513_3144.p1  ORF type:complete len:449 (-),score=236.53 gnl/Dysnectes_brevis/461_a513_3144:71-1417(-)
MSDVPGIKIPTILLPNPKLVESMQNFAAIACDQHTDKPDWWNEVFEIVGDHISTLFMVLPEVFLEHDFSEEKMNQRIEKINKTMHEYIAKGVFREHHGVVFLRRYVPSVKTWRNGVMVALDLEQYDFSPTSSTLVRATERTVEDRLPPRIKIRKDAPIEFPHIMVLIDDPSKTIIEPLVDQTSEMECLYDFDLMRESGHISGWAVPQEKAERLFAGIHGLFDRDLFTKKYAAPADKDLLIYAMGDGNHSLATAKCIWEKVKEEAADHEGVMQDPRRYALVELVNLHDDSLEFEPIHRVLYECTRSPLEMLAAELPGFTSRPVPSAEELEAEVRRTEEGVHKVGMYKGEEFLLCSFTPQTKVPLAAVQPLLDTFVTEGGCKKIDYVHGTSSFVAGGAEEGCWSVFFDVLKKHELYPSVIFDGVLPRKTFSMGEAEDKRFYLEGRSIAPL